MIESLPAVLGTRGDLWEPQSQRKVLLTASSLREFITMLPGRHVSTTEEILRL